MSPRSFTAAVAAALALLVPIGAACSSDDEDEGVLRTQTTESQPDGGDDGATGSTDGGNSDGDVPEDAALDVHVRTPGGVTLNVSRISFDGEDILVEDAGQDYSLIESTDASSPMAEGKLVLQPGESVEGTFAFRGPLSGQPGSVSLVTNLSTADIASYEVESQTETYYPAFVVPMDLTWA